MSASVELTGVILRKILDAFHRLWIDESYIIWMCSVEFSKT